MGLKPILPSLKEKKRYLAFEIISKDTFNVEQAGKAVVESCLSYLGTLDAGKAGFMFLKDKYNNNKGILKTGHKYVDKVRASLALIKTIDSKEVIVRTRVVSGTLKKAISKSQWGGNNENTNYFGLDRNYPGNSRDISIVV